VHYLAKTDMLLNLTILRGVANNFVGRDKPALPNLKATVAVMVAFWRFWGTATKHLPQRSTIREFDLQPSGGETDKMGRSTTCSGIQAPGSATSPSISNRATPAAPAASPSLGLAKKCRLPERPRI
jgi:hypothetical protein